MQKNTGSGLRAVNLIRVVSLIVASLACTVAQGADSWMLPNGRIIRLSLGDITQKRGQQGETTAIVSAANKYMDYVGAGGVAGV